MPTFQYSLSSERGKSPLPSAEEVLLSLSEPLFRMGDMKKALQEILNHGVDSTSKGLEGLLNEVRAIKVSLLQEYDLKPTLQDLQAGLQKQRGTDFSEPGTSDLRKGAKPQERKGGAHVFDLSEERKKVRKRSRPSMGYLVSLLKDITAQFEFTGSKPLSPEEVPWLIERMGILLQVEKDIQRAIWGYDLDAIESQNISEVLGEEARETWEGLKKVKAELEDSGLLEPWRNNYRLSPRGFRIISAKILKEIFDLIKAGLPGKHPANAPGEGNIDLTTSRPYTFGLPLNLNLPKTLMNTLIREARRPPLYPKSEDFEVYNPESFTRSATVLMVDMSQSMKDRNNFVMAKKVTLALNDLIRRNFPRDRLEIIGFSTAARTLLPKELPYLLWDAEQSYTNIQEGLHLSRKILRRGGYHNKQVILITDGEPTAHSEGNKLYFQFPPHPRTVEVTLQEVKRCTREGILIHTFMLAKTNPLTNFVAELTKINPGKAYYTDSNHLGEYVIVDYLQRKT